MAARLRFDQVQVDSVTMKETVEHISKIMQAPRTRAHQVVTVNAQFVQLARKEPDFAALIRRAELSVADGVPLLWASRILGNPLPERVNGTDLVVRLCEAAAARKNSIYFLGGRTDAARLAARQLQATYPGFRIAGIDCPSFGFELNPILDDQVSERIRQAKPDLVLVAMGAPRAEYWIVEHMHLPAKVMVGVGGSFELIAGMTKRAPMIMQRNGCEWLWRLIMEPRRLWKRYLTGNSLFLYLLVRHYCSSSNTMGPNDGLMGTFGQWKTLAVIREEEGRSLWPRG